MSSATPDEDLPGGGGGGAHCANGETRGFYQVLLECRSGNGLYWRLICDDIQVDINPDRVLIQHGANVTVEVRSDKIITRAPVLEHHGNISIDGDVHITGDVVVEKDVVASEVSLTQHIHLDPGNAAPFTGRPASS